MSTAARTATTPAAPKPPRKQTLRLSIAPEPDPLESWHQETVFRMAELNKGEHPELADLYHTPNGGFRAKATAAAMQRQGVKPGIPDLTLPHARGGYFGLYIELKRFRNGRVEDVQKDRIERLHRAGYRVVVCWGWRIAWAELLRYLSLPPTVSTVTPTNYNPFAKPANVQPANIEPANVHCSNFQPSPKEL